MAGNAKPNIPGLGPEGVIIIKEHPISQYDVPFNDLINGTVPNTPNQIALNFQRLPEIEFELKQHSNIWAIGDFISDSGGSSGQSITVFKEENKAFVQLYSDVKTYVTGKWYKMISLEKGFYKFKLNKNYVSWHEWYIEKISNDLLIKSKLTNNTLTISNNKLLINDSTPFDDLTLVNNKYNEIYSKSTPKNLGTGTEYEFEIPRNISSIREVI